MSHSRIFLLSPARTDGARARLLLEPRSSFAMAERLREPDGAQIGELFSFLSGLYFRGKLEYARAFGQTEPAALGAPGGPGAVHVITADRGLVAPETRFRVPDIARFATVDIGAGDERFLAPLRRDAKQLARALEPSAAVVLLGSIATDKYVETLLDAFGERLLFPAEFVGRGDMSRGGLLLRHVRSRRELDYIPVAGAVRRGRRPPKLERLPRE